MLKIRSFSERKKSSQLNYKHNLLNLERCIFNNFPRHKFFSSLTSYTQCCVRCVCLKTSVLSHLDGRNVKYTMIMQKFKEQDRARARERERRTQTHKKVESFAPMHLRLLEIRNRFCSKLKIEGVRYKLNFIDKSVDFT